MVMKPACRVRVDGRKRRFSKRNDFEGNDLADVV